MKKFVQLSLAVAVAAACSMASAGVVTFENVDSPTGPIIGHNTEAYEGDIWMVGKSRAGGPANPEVFGGLVVDGADPYGCMTLCPTGNSSRFFGGIDGGYLMFGHDKTQIAIKGFEAGYINVDPSVPFTGTTELVLQGGWFAGGFLNSALLTLDKGSFTSFDLTALDANFANTYFDYVFVFGLANRAFSNDSNFAIDNITYVPEPSSFALVGLSLLVLGATRRRKA